MKKLVNYFWQEYDQMEVELNLLPKWRKRGIKFFCFLLSFYITLTRIAIHTSFPTTFLGVVFESMVCFGFQLTNRGTTINCHDENAEQEIFDTHQAKFNWKIFIQIFLVVCLPLLIALIAYFPGGLDIDNLSQWWQAQNFKFDDWHPVTHSLMIWVLTCVVNHLSFFLFVQLVLYSLSVAALLHTLFSWVYQKL